MSCGELFNSEMFNAEADGGFFVSMEISKPSVVSWSHSRILTTMYSGGLDDYVNQALIFN